MPQVVAARSTTPLLGFVAVTVPLLALIAVRMFAAVAVLVPRAKFVPEVVPAVPAVTEATVTLVPSLVPDMTALSAQRAVIVWVALPLLLEDETSGLALVTLRVQVLPPLPQVPLSLIATDKFCAVSSSFVVELPVAPIKT